MKAIVICCALAVLVVSSSCYTSPPPQNYGPALAPNGVHGVLATGASAALSGELLEVRDSAYVMLVDSRVVIVPYRLIRSADFEHQDWAQFGSITKPSASTRERLRWDSRFPFGIRDEAMAALLRRSGQSRPDVVSDTPP
jgi:hypothetical protein